MAISSKVLISVKHLVKEYNHGTVHALDGCDLDIHKGEVVAIIGPSGSGKSTLLRSLNLLEEPTSGAIFFDGVDLASKQVNIDQHRQKMGMVFQHFNLFPHKTVLQNITLAPVTLKKKHPLRPRPRPAPFGAHRPVRQGQRVPQYALRRSEAAYRHRSGAGHGSGGHALR